MYSLQTSWQHNPSPQSDASYGRLTQQRPRHQRSFLQGSQCDADPLACTGHTTSRLRGHMSRKHGRGEERHSHKIVRPSCDSSSDRAEETVAITAELTPQRGTQSRDICSEIWAPPRVGPPPTNTPLAHSQSCNVNHWMTVYSRAAQVETLLSLNVTKHCLALRQSLRSGRGHQKGTTQTGEFVRKFVSRRS